MPAIITHYFFGQDLYKNLTEFIGDDPDVKDAYLLGNQGPDPLFFLVFSPRYLIFQKLAGKMHREKPAELLEAFNHAYRHLPQACQPVGRGYALGFLGHYLLDSHEHPFVYAWQDALCEAGIEGLDFRAKDEVHNIIEHDIDEVMLYNRLHTTIQSFVPGKVALHASEEVLAIISRIYVTVMRRCYGQEVPQDLYTKALHCYRLGEHLFYSATGKKRDIIARVESSVRGRSIYDAMSHRIKTASDTLLANPDHLPWKNPATGKESVNSFWDIYEETLAQASGDTVRFAQTHFGAAEAQNLTHGINFLGQPTNVQVSTA
ncbi:MAG: peptidase [Eggerthellaceae bacterium]|jgi:hypothetical protein